MKHVSDDHRLQQKILKAVKKMSAGPHVQVGILQDKPRDDGFSMTALAAVHEYGSSNGHIPARSFIRSTCDAKQKQHMLLIKKLEEKVFMGQISLKQALTTLGEVVSKDMVQTINRGIAPDLAQSTKAAKKRSMKRQKRRLTGIGFKPLIETGQLKGAITHDARNVT